ncbi:hypothetical protein QBC38DRAFT_355012 [Podospora fimiseda]|uniref:Uncharacterized protein n=1 Tax=Podospora fimiseda TaxID=252190 RepID=A0AAN7BXG4_9PEZI|nr:hypothetical protein QBC38DRAFT_355012 [Podospora fimiseda]
MGIFSFFHKKSNKNKPAALKAHAYDSTSAGSLPIHGAYPVSGNGPNVIDTLSRGRPSLPLISQTQSAEEELSVPDEPAAPAPGVPLYRNESVERPSTAPNGRPPSFFSNTLPRMKKSHIKKPPPVSFKMFNSSNGSAPPGSRPASQGSEFTTCRPRAHSRSNSIRSDGGKGFKDILDAHSEIAPSDFKARIKASGVKDYGEDVADRNIGENGFNLESNHVRSFYAQSGVSLPVANRPVASLPLSQRSSRSSIRESSQARWPKPTTPRVIPKGFTASVPRYKSTESGLYNDIKTKGGGHLVRRVSVNTYMPPTSQNNETTPRTSSSQHHPSKLPDLDFGPLNTPIVLSPPKFTTVAAAPRTPRMPRDSLMLAKRKAETFVVSDRMVVVDDDVDLNSSSSPERKFSLRSASSFTRNRSGSDTAYQHHQIPRKRHSLHTLQSSISSTIASNNRDSTFIFQPTTPLAYPRSVVLSSSSHYQQVAPKEDSESSPPMNQPFTIHEEDSSSSRPPSRSFPLITTEAIATTTITKSCLPGPVPSHHRTDIMHHEVSDDSSPSVIIRTRSLRGWSESSGTQSSSTTARSSSPSFLLRPTTASTSIIDLTPTALSPPPTPKSFCGTEGFNIDDYVSDDEEERPSGEGEEDLLFKDLEGYGGKGFELPGLNDCLFEEEEEGWEYDGIGGSFGRVGGRRYVLDCGVDEEDEYEEEGEMKRFEALGGEGEEGVMGVKVMDLVRLRKEVKRSRRLNGEQGAGGLRVRRLGVREVKEVRSVPVLCVEGEKIY